MGLQHLLTTKKVRVSCFFSFILYHLQHINFLADDFMYFNQTYGNGKVQMTCQDTGQFFVLSFLVLKVMGSLFVYLFYVLCSGQTLSYPPEHLYEKSARIIIFTAYTNRAFCDKMQVDEELYHRSGIISNYVFFACSCLSILLKVLIICQNLEEAWFFSTP